MAIALAIFAGGPQANLTSPTYTPVADVAPDVNGRQYAVTTLGGTQTGVTLHSASSPFTVTFIRPKVFKTLGQVNPVTGALSSVPKNQWKFIVRKGMTPLAGQAPAIGIATLTIDIPAGADTADAPNLRALMSATIGALWDQSTLFGNSVVSGVL